MVLILYGSVANPPVRAVLLTVKALNIQVLRKDVNLLAEEQLNPDYIKMNPQHTVPTLDDDGFIIWDSHAIITYLVRKYATDDHLYPKDFQTRAKIDQRLHFEGSIIYPRMRDIFCSVVIENKGRISQQQKGVIAEVYNLLEVFLRDGDYMVGDALTLADLSIIPSFSSINNMVPADVNRYPRLIRWFERCKGLPFYEEANGLGLLGMTKVFVNKLENDESGAA